MGTCRLPAARGQADYAAGRAARSAAAFWKRPPGSAATHRARKAVHAAGTSRGSTVSTARDSETDFTDPVEARADCAAVETLLGVVVHGRSWTSPPRVSMKTSPSE